LVAADAFEMALTIIVPSPDPAIQCGIAIACAAGKSQPSQWSVLLRGSAAFGAALYQL